MPPVDLCVDQLAGSKILSVLDLKCGFWQSEIRPEDRDKTAFITRNGQYRYKVLCFGLTNAPSLFQSLMNLVLAGVLWRTCLVYVDDVIVMVESVEQMAERLEEVLGRFRNASLKLKPTKCRLFQTKVNFLGHIISAAGIEADPEKIRAVAQWPVPTNVTDTRAFVSLAAYYRKFIKHFSAIAAPLYELTRKNEKFVWNERRQQAFERLKQSLVSAPVLALPRDEGAFVVDVDAGPIQTGGVLQQWQDGELKVVAYFSRLLSRSEEKYCITKKELLAIVHALKLWKTYLLGRKITLRTDHAALMYLRRTPEPIAQQARWLNFIETFHIDLVHRSGVAHRNADSLSRRPCDTDEPCKQCSGKKSQSHNGAVMNE